MATYYTLQARGVAKAVHAGTQCADADTANAATLDKATALTDASAGDVVNVFKVPRGAILEELTIVGHGGGQSVIFDVGYAGNASIFGSFALLATNATVSPSGRVLNFDSADLSYSAAANDWLLKFTCTTATSITAAASWYAQLRYHMD